MIQALKKKSQCEKKYILKFYFPHFFVKSIETKKFKRNNL